MDWKNKLPQIQNRLRFQLFSRKYDGMDRVFELFSECDRDGSGSLNRYEFENFLSKVGMFVSTQEQSELFRYYDKNGDGQISVSEFLQGLQNGITEVRLSAVKSAFQFLDSSNSGLLSVSDLISRYSATDHPRVVTREKTAELVRQEFQNSISKYAQGGNLTEDGFLAYYVSLNATIPSENDDYFTSLLTGCWRINSGVDYVTPQRLSQIEEIFYEKLRQRSRSTEDEGQVMVRLFRFFDREENGDLTFEVFSSALDHLGCKFSQNEVRALYSRYSSSQSYNKSSLIRPSAMSSYKA